MTLQRRYLLAATLASSLVALPSLGVAQTLQDKPVTIVVPFAPGGPADVLARALGDVLGASLKRTVIVDNRAGATGNLGAQAVVRAAPDGHTLLLTLDTTLTANPSLYGKRLGFDPASDLVAITLIGRYDQMLAVHPGTGITDLKQFIEASKKGLAYASAGNASPGHLTMESLQALLPDAKLTHIPYKGAAPAAQDLLGGQVQAAFLVTPGVAPHVASGKLRALAVSGRKRSPLAPGVPTVAELGYANATTEFAYVLMAPKGTPPALVQMLHGEAAKALADPGLRERMGKLDVTPVGSTPADAAAELTSGRQRWARTIKERNITAE